MNSREILINGGKELGLEIDDLILDKFFKFKDILIEWNNKINLTGITEEKEIMIKHFLDSLTCILSGVIRQDSKIIDVGTGAGFPGIPLKIYYEGLNLTLLDSLKKRINYLDIVCKECNLSNVELIHGRAEDYGKNKAYREKFDIATARAVADLKVLSEYCLPFIRKGGFFIAQKGPTVDDEVSKSNNAIKTLGGKIVDNISINLPFTDINHSLIIIEKVKATPDKYPRRSGIPAKKPIV